MKMVWLQSRSRHLHTDVRSKTRDTTTMQFPIAGESLATKGSERCVGRC